MVPQICGTLLWAWPEGLNGNRSCPPTEFFSARAMKLHAFVDRFGSWIRTIPVGRDTFRGEREFWRATAEENGTLYFHPPDVPIRIWAVSIQPARVIWAESEIGRISEMSVAVRYAGETARLDREKLWRSCPAHVLRPGPRTSPHRGPVPG